MILFEKATAQDCAILTNRLNEYGEFYGWDLFSIQCLPLVDMIGDVLGFSIEMGEGSLQLLPLPIRAV